MEAILKQNKKVARIIGVFFLVVIAAYATGNGLITSVLDKPDYLSNIYAYKMQIITGALLMLLNSIMVTAIGVMILPILEKHNKTIAFGYFSSRFAEALILAIGVTFLASQIIIGQEYLNGKASDIAYFQALSTLSVKGNYFAYQIAMISLGLGSIMFCYLLYQSKLIPKIASVCGMIGYALLLLGAILELFGFNVGVMLSIPGGLFEIFLGFWLIIKGFNTSETTANIT